MPPASTQLVLVSGSGRSGTSSLAGTLKRLGLHVPQPEVQPGPANPRGFYEPRWVIRFHSAFFKELAVHNIDSRPSAVEQIREATADGAATARLTDWLRTQMDQPRLVIKDPHAFWFADVWATACAELGIDLCWLTSIRHPAEVVGSRDLAYLQGKPDEVRRVKETSNVAGWVHAALLTERAGREGRRSFIRYTDLIADWRRSLAPVASQLDLALDADLGTTTHHAVDDFLDTSMRHSTLTWDDIKVSRRLQDMAEEVWQILQTLVDEPHDRTSADRLDEIHADYVEMYTDAAALTYDDRRASVKLATRRARQQKQRVVRRLRRRLRRADGALEQARHRAVAAEQAGVTAAVRRRVGSVVRRVRG